MFKPIAFNFHLSGFECPSPTARFVEERLYTLPTLGRWPGNFGFEGGRCQGGSVVLVM